MAPLSAEILTEHVSHDGRRAVRRSLRLGVQAYASGDIAMALILNMSETGLLLESVIQLGVGETLQVDIPEIRHTAICVVWTDGFLAGCKFVDRVSTGAVSAAQLKASASEAGNPDQRDCEPLNGWDRDEAASQWAIVMISALISAVALIVFLAAISLI